MRIAVTAGYWSSGPPAGSAETFAVADRLEIDQVWTAEAYGSDAWTPLAWWGSRTKHVKLGTAVSQLSARPPVTLAMTAMTMDHLTEGRVLLGVGTSNPQVVEGWYGQPYPRPLERTREYIDILRKVIAREEPVVYDGKHYQLPLGDGTGLGKPLRSILHPYRTEIPIYLGAEGPKNVALGAEIADGWNVIFFSPKMNDFYGAALAEGFARPGARHTAETFDVVGGPLAIIPDDDTERAADLLRPTLALYIGGMGARGVNFHHEVFVRMGYEAEAKKIQDLYLAGDKQSAIAAVPTAMVEDVALIGPWAKIADELPSWQATVLTTFSVPSDPRHFDRIVGLLRNLSHAIEPPGSALRTSNYGEHEGGVTAPAVDVWGRRGGTPRCVWRDSPGPVPDGLPVDTDYRLAVPAPGHRGVRPGRRDPAGLRTGVRDPESPGYRRRWPAALVR
jgi:F420-dependent oxidoreductase-like protein